MSDLRDTEFGSRDTHFQGFAKLLFQELYGVDDSFEYPEPVRIIARRAYDLVAHTLNLVPPMVSVFPNAQSVDEVISYIPDLTEWPTDPGTSRQTDTPS